MGHDPFSPVSLAQINILCVPASRISKADFERCVNKLRSCSVLRTQQTLSNGADSVPSSGRGSWTLLNVSQDTSVDVLSDFYPIELNRRPQIIIGVICGKDGLQRMPEFIPEEIKSLEATFKANLNLYPQAISSSLVVFGGAAVTEMKDLIWMDPAAETAVVEELMGEIVATFLRGLPELMEKLRSQSFTLFASSETARRTSLGANRPSWRDSPPNSELRSPEGSQHGNEVTSRQAVVFGLIYLQAGQWSNALRLLAEGAAISRSLGDHSWHARALEALLTCMLLTMWAQVDFNIPQICYPSNEKHSQTVYSDLLSTILNANRPTTVSLFGNMTASSSHTLTELIPHLLSTITGHYERSTYSTEDPKSFMLLYEARIRWVNLLLSIVTNSASLSTTALQEIVYGSSHQEQYVNSKSPMPSLVLTRGSLSKALQSTSVEARQHLTVEQATGIQLAIARSLSLLKINRKQGFHLKQFFQTLAPVLIDARRRAAAELGVHPSAHVPQLANGSSFSDDSSRKGVGEMLRSVAAVYGLPMPHPWHQQDKLTAADRLGQALIFWSATHNSGDLFVKLEILSMCIEISDAVPDYQSNLYFTSYLLSASKKALTVTAASRAQTPLIAAKDLPHLLQNMRRAINAAERAGLTGVGAEYWDKFLVRDISLIDNYGSNKLMPHTAYDLSLAAGVASAAKRDPFIFNPFAKPEIAKGELVVTVGDLVDFSAILQNPLDVEIEIESIMLIGEGCQFTPSDHSIVLGALCIQTFVLQGKALSTGPLNITGCRVKIRGCHSEDFLILPADWSPTYKAKQRTRTASRAKPPALHLPTAKQLALKVITSLPILSVASSTLVQPSLMLLEGESSDVELTLHNGSDMVIDFITLTFADSVTSGFEDALGNKDLSPTDTYEVQYQMLNKPAIQWLNKSADLRIEGGDDAIFHLRIFGKPGLSFINVLIDYAFLGKPKTEVTETFYTRQLIYSVATSINSSINIPRCVIMPFEDDIQQFPSNDIRPVHYQVDHSQNSAAVFDDSNRCMMLLDVRNVWPHPLEVNVVAQDAEDATHTTDQDKNATGTVSELILPGHTNRIVLLIPRIFISNARATIPNLDTKRQFVVSAAKMSVEAEATSREAFWYREKLLERLKVTWREQVGSRRGQVDMRKAVRLNLRMVEALKIDQVEIRLALRKDPGDSSGTSKGTYIQDLGVSHYALGRNQFATLVARVYNRGDTNVALLLRLQPSLRDQTHNVALELSKRFLWSGSLQQALQPPLQVGELRELELGIIVLAKGKYEVSALVEEIQRQPSRDVVKTKDIDLNQERRVWYARRPCCIDVVDDETKYAIK